MTSKSYKKKSKHINQKPIKMCIRKQMKDSEIKKKEGHFFDEKHYNFIIKEDCDVYIKDKSNEKEKLLLSFRKNVIPRNICCQAYNSLEREAQKKHNNRGSAGGILKTKNLPNYVKKTTKKSKFRSYYIGKDGKEKKDHISNYVSSGIIGYFDRYDRNAFKKSNGKKISKKNRPSIPCRTTKFTREQVSKWKKTIPLIKYGNRLFKKLAPNKHKIQLERARKTPDYQIENTAFSTVTINFNYRTGTHKDRGDFEEGFGNLIVLEKSECFPGSDSYEGGYLGFPQYKVAVDVRQGDFLAMNVHEWHTNTKITPTKKSQTNFGRLSLVCYLRKNMIKCSNK